MAKVKHNPKAPELIEEGQKGGENKKKKIKVFLIVSKKLKVV
jgi:hypothetical protein